MHERPAYADAAAHVLKADGAIENCGKTTERFKNLAGAKCSFLVSLHGF